MNKNVTSIIRFVLGLGFLVFGLNKFLWFMSGPAPEGVAGELMAAIMSAGYILPLVGILEVGVGIMLLFRWHPALATVIAFPLTFNFVLFHLFLMPAGIAGALVFFILNIYLIVAYKEAYSSLCGCCAKKKQTVAAPKAAATTVAKAAPKKRAKKASKRASKKAAKKRK